MIKYILLIFLPFNVIKSKDYCEVFDAKLDLKYDHCIDKKKVFAYFYHFHENPNLEYKFNTTYKIQFPKIFELQILNFIEHNCYVIENDVRIKEITNKENKNYKTKIIISCIYKS